MHVVALSFNSYSGGLQAEKAAETAAKGIRLIILRPAVVYGQCDCITSINASYASTTGPADVSGLMPRAVCAAAYFKMQDKMQFLWNAKTMLNTVCQSMCVVLPGVQSQTFSLCSGARG